MAIGDIVESVISFLNGPTIGIKPISGNFVKPQITIDERYNHALTITDHPVDKNANITDHAYKQPDRVSINVAWSETPSISILTAPANFLNQFKINNMMDIFDMFTTYQNNRIRCTVYTYKKVYQSMLIESISSYTDDETYRSMFMTLNFKEVIIASTQQVPNVFANSTNPNATSNPANLGVQTPQAGTPSNSTVVGSSVA